MLKHGRFIPSLDHLVPPDVPWEAFCYYIFASEGSDGHRLDAAAGAESRLRRSRLQPEEI